MHKSNGGYEFWDSKKDEVISKYVDDGRSSNSIATDYGCDSSTILRQLKRWDIGRRKDRYNSTYNVDLSFFNVIDSEEKAYFLGLLLADGHVSKRNVIMLTLKDKDVLEKYLFAIKCNAPIRIDRYGNYAANITSKTLADALRNIGLHNRKSYEVNIRKVKSCVPKELEHHFISGMFDGDGSIRVYNYEYLKNPQLHFGFTGLFDVVEYVKNYFGIKTKTVKESEITYTCVSSCRETIYKIYRSLYKNATVYMDRKYSTFQKIFDT